MKPKGETRLTFIGIKRLNQVLKDLQDHGVSKICPFSYKAFKKTDFTLNTECKICFQAFPKSGNNCPCHSGYTLKYLIQRVEEIIKSRKI